MEKLADSALSELTLYFDGAAGGWIEWEIDGLEITETIGLWFEIDATGKRTLAEYDGVFTLPDQAMQLLELCGVDCSEVRQCLAV